MTKSSNEIRKSFFDFWTSEPRNLKVVPNMSLVPNVDSTLLFVNSGMFPLAPYLGGQPHPLGTRLTNFQRCLRTNYDEMLEIGDNRHTLMFEMMGDWSLGDFFKKEQIPWILELHVKYYGIDPSRLYVTVFAGDDDAPRDNEAIDLWKEAFAKYGIDAEFSEDITNIPSSIEEGKEWKYRIFPYPKKKNWWERAHAPNELGGPCSEIFYDLGEVLVTQDKYHVNDDSGRFIEIGNNVFMQYKLDENLKWQPLKQKNVDFGGGFERVVMVVQGKSDIFETDLYEPIIKTIEEISGKNYKTDGEENEYTAAFRIIADHARAATFILGDGITPSNKDQGYILRRFIRRLIRFGKKLGIEINFTQEIALSVIDRMKEAYPHLMDNQSKILAEFEAEEIKFRKTLNNGLKIVSKINPAELTGEVAFNIYETYGFPLELIFDELKIQEDQIPVIQKAFNEEENKHRESSRLGSEQKFKGGLADQSEETTKLHTAHHLLLAALQKIIDPEIRQRGSNITAERLRIDFSYGNKLSEEQLREVEDLVNQKIEEGLNVIRVEMQKSEAEKLGAQMEFGQKYADTVSVYFITDEDSNSVPSSWFSAEFCGGPHVQNTSELAKGGRKFKILKEESSSAGVRRIKASLV